MLVRVLHKQLQIAGLQIFPINKLLLKKSLPRVAISRILVTFMVITIQGFNFWPERSPRYAQNTLKYEDIEELSPYMYEKELIDKDWTILSRKRI